MSAPVGLIVGSGMMDFAAGADCVDVHTRYGEPSAALRRTTISGAPVVVLPRHGDRHSIPPHRVNYRANLKALQQQGCEAVISVNTVGVIRADVRPGSLAVPDQVIDYTWGREHTYFDGGDGRVEHVDVSQPFSAALRADLLAAARAAGARCANGGVYGATQGPRLETAAEIDRLERDGVDFVGMTGMPEFCLARELGLEVACLSLVVNPAAGRGSGSIHADITATMAEAKSSAISVLETFLGQRAV